MTIDLAKRSLFCALLLTSGCAHTFDALTNADAGADTAVADGDASIDAAPSDARVDGGLDCGGADPTLLATGPSAAHVIARDGTIYYASRRAVGRVAPDGAIDTEWLPIVSEDPLNRIGALALDASNRTLYVADVFDVLFRVDLGASTPTPELWQMLGMDARSGLVADDGWIYMADATPRSASTSGSVALAWAPEGGAGAIVVPLLEPIDHNVTGMAFADATHLLVASSQAGTILSLTLGGEHEDIPALRTIVATVPDARGIALDALGRLYASTGTSVVRVGASGMPEETLLVGYTGISTIEWSPAACGGLYVSTDAGLVRVPSDVEQRSLPWH